MIEILGYLTPLLVDVPKIMETSMSLLLIEMVELH